MTSHLNHLDIGGKLVPQDDFNDLLHQMQFQVPCEDLWRLLGVYKESYNGELLLAFLKGSMTDPQSIEFLDYLILNGYIAPVSYAGSNQFKSNSFYQWKATAAEFSNEPSAKKERREAVRLAFDARRNAQKLETLRLSLDLQFVEYFYRSLTPA